MGKFGSCSVGRKNDRRWRLSPQAIATIQKLHGQGKSMNSLAVRFGVDSLTVRYWVDDKYRDHMRAMNALRRRTKDEEKVQSENKEIRRNLVRHKVREYNRKQIADYRKKNREKCLKQEREYMREWRAKNPERAKENQNRWWHKKKCSCLKYGDHHIYGFRGWPKGRKRGAR